MTPMHLHRDYIRVLMRQAEKEASPDLLERIERNLREYRWQAEWRDDDALPSTERVGVLVREETAPAPAGLLEAPKPAASLSGAEPDSDHVQASLPDAGRGSESGPASPALTAGSDPPSSAGTSSAPEREGDDRAEYDRIIAAREERIESAATKRCGKCGNTQPLDAFSLSRARADGRQVYCKACSQKQVADSRKRKKVAASRSGVGQTDLPADVARADNAGQPGSESSAAMSYAVHVDRSQETPCAPSSRTTPFVLAESLPKSDAAFWAECWRETSPKVRTVTVDTLTDGRIVLDPNDRLVAFELEPEALRTLRQLEADAVEAVA